MNHYCNEIQNTPEWWRGKKENLFALVLKIAREMNCLVPRWICGFRAFLHELCCSGWWGAGGTYWMLSIRHYVCTEGHWDFAVRNSMKLCLKLEGVECGHLFHLAVKCYLWPSHYCIRFNALSFSALSSNALFISAFHSFFILAVYCIGHLLESKKKKNACFMA